MMSDGVSRCCERLVLCNNTKSKSRSPIRTVIGRHSK